MSKFTPGPWRKNGGMIYAEVNRKTIAVAEVFDGADDCDLVAAAPDMYEALDFGAQMTLHEMSIGEMADALREWQTVAKLVLSKAEGKQ